ncbi:hypothetical protein [Diaminobutyricimonas sp. LJ205]|uniref:hypothetical protein n=1 Tax=Diaminobutyricimonas sp. LJ205 TaxID=2683590 RepID=UPI0012F4E90A|nr:hypothetical protein [Diaminobutyricimonas sp. LJ205]
MRHAPIRLTAIAAGITFVLSVLLSMLLAAALSSDNTPLIVTSIQVFVVLVGIAFLVWVVALYIANRLIPARRVGRAILTHLLTALVIAIANVALAAALSAGGGPWAELGVFLVGVASAEFFLSAVMAVLITHLAIARRLVPDAPARAAGHELPL